MDEKTLLSTIGELKFKRCYYLEKSSCKRIHILDDVIGITSNTKKTEDVVERILNHACHSSYRISDEDRVSLQFQKEKGSLENSEVTRTIPICQD